MIQLRVLFGWTWLACSDSARFMAVSVHCHANEVWCMPVWHLNWFFLGGGRDVVVSVCLERKNVCAFLSFYQKQKLTLFSASVSIQTPICVFSSLRKRVELVKEHSFGMQAYWFGCEAIVVFLFILMNQPEVSLVNHLIHQVKQKLRHGTENRNWHWHLLVWKEFHPVLVHHSWWHFFRRFCGRPFSWWPTEPAEHLQGSKGQQLNVLDEEKQAPFECHLSFHLNILWKGRKY